MKCLPAPLDWGVDVSCGMVGTGVDVSLSPSGSSSCGSDCSSRFESSFLTFGDDGALSASGDVCHGDVPAGWSGSFGKLE